MDSMVVRALITSLWEGVEPHSMPPAQHLISSIKTIYDGDGLLELMGLICYSLYEMETRAPAEPTEDCRICLGPFFTPVDLSGRKNRRKRQKMHQASVAGRPFVPASNLDVYEFVPGCGHVFHSHCFRQLRLTCDPREQPRCPLCRQPAPFTVRCDVVIHQDDSIYYHQLASVRRAFLQCKWVADGERCPHRSRCRFSHWTSEHGFVQTDPPQEPRLAGNILVPAGAESEVEDWDDEGQDEAASLPPQLPPPRLFTRSGRVPRGPGTRGSGLVPVLDTQTGVIVRVPPEVLRLDVNNRYSRNLGPRNSRQ